MPADPHSGLYVIDEWTVLGVGGADAPDFLHGQFTNDLLALPEDRAQLSAYCMPRGQVIANFLIWRTAGDQYRIALPSELVRAVSQRLQLFTLRADVEIASLAETLALFGIAGTASEENPAGPVELPPSPLGKTQTGPYTAIAAIHADQERIGHVTTPLGSAKAATVSPDRLLPIGFRI